MKLILSLALVAFVAHCSFSSPVEEEITSWEQFKQVFNKQYESPLEESIRKANFEKALKFVLEHNSQNKLGHQLGIHENSDLSELELTMNPASMEEFMKILNSTPVYIPDVDEYEALPAQFDWRQQTQINPVENQGQCGSCWAFACSFTVEVQLAYRRNTHVRLSKQELVDCSSHSYDTRYQNQGCNIGYPPSAYQYIIDHGLHAEDSYPYKGLANELCYTSRLAQANKYAIQGTYRLASRSSDETIMNVLRQYGPTVVVIHGTDPHFAQYKSGIIRDLLPNSAQVNHVVGVVGWGTEGGVDYWIIRNSWGVNWGEHGYARIERHHNLVAFNNWVSYPIMH